jgi:hypothetical protein
MRFLMSILLTLALALSSAAQVQVTPTTTLAAETGNNTSAASSFAGSSNGNFGAGNVSKEDVHKLLYANATSKVFAHYQPWWGTSSHMNIGMDQSDPLVVLNQVRDALSRGLAGFIVDWYGTPDTTQKAFEDKVAMNVRDASEKLTAQFAIQEDSGAIKGAADVTQKVIDDLNYAASNYYGSPAYLNDAASGRPVVFFFGTEAYSIDWTRVRNGVRGNPLFIFRNSGGFTKAQSNGGFAWVGMNAPEGIDYLDNFYTVAGTHADELVFGAAYKGFNDSIASWGSNRVVQQGCGKTLMDTAIEPGKFYSQTKQLAYLQIVTWNDYEEGSEIETGVDNCVSVTASMDANKVLNWTVTGDPLTIDHFTVFVSVDGNNLMELANLDRGGRSLNVAAYNFPTGTYYFYVKAVGMPLMTNKMSGRASYPVAPPPPVLNVVVTSPVAGSTVTSPVSVVASAVDTVAPVTSMAVYFNSKLYAKVNAASITKSFSLRHGSYKLTVQFWDAAGTVTKKSITVNVR